ncbi:calmodulin-binding transcription activator 1-like, partial [Carica papaya]|uniref:calmodulin-binding transcription activator 1-like n=1 Tax=Carica papaya TaxID=3649 RepID=UPI000B8CF6DF
MLEPDLMHIVFVHYLEVKGSRTNIGGIKETKEVLSNFQDGSSSRNTDSTSPTSTLTSLCEDADSGDSHQTSSGSHILPESPHVGCAQITEKRDFDLLNSYLMQSSGKQESWTTVPSISNIHGNSPVESVSQSA